MHLCIHTCMHIHKWIYMHKHACKQTYNHARIHTYMFLVNFDALAQATDIRIERRQVVFLSWMQDSNQGLSNPISSRVNARWQTYWAIVDQAKKTWTRQPVPMISEHSAHSTPLSVGFRAWLWRYTCFLLLISKLWHRQAIFESKGDKLSSSVECRIRTKVFATESPADRMPADNPIELSGIKLKTLLNEFDSIKFFIYLLQFQWNMLLRTQYKIRNRSYR